MSKGDDLDGRAASVLRTLEWLPKVLEACATSLPPRWRRWLAMYYPDAGIRRVFWRHSGVTMGTGTYANYGMKVVSDPTNEEIGVRIGDFVSIAPGVVFVVDSAPNNSPRMQQIPYVRDHLVATGRIEVGNHVWIGANAVIFPGVTIGECAIVGAGSIVRENVEALAVVAGAPARKIRTLQPEAN